MNPAEVPGKLAIRPDLWFCTDASECPSETEIQTSHLLPQDNHLKRLANCHRNVSQSRTNANRTLLLAVYIKTPVKIFGGGTPFAPYSCASNSSFLAHMRISPLPYS